ncbi:MULTISPECIES: TIGR03032 family protein [unclassified Nostoc]|nr:TIGR03032 family protein [Nostoc sp. KVJ20]
MDQFLKAMRGCAFHGDFAIVEISQPSTTRPCDMVFGSNSGF